MCLELCVGSHSRFHTKSHQQLLSKIYAPKKGRKCVLNVCFHIKTKFEELPNVECCKSLLQTLPSVNCRQNKLEIQTPVPQAFL